MDILHLATEHDRQYHALQKEVAQLRAERDSLYAALLGLVGVETREELTAMEIVLRQTPIPDQDKASMLNAIHVLLEVMQ